jgi:predicted dinucleotide-binding enzyme
MQITIIGAGNMARGIATRALTGGHNARIIDRAPDKAARLAAGLCPIDAGPLKRARELEGFQLLHMTLQQTLRTNWSSAIKILI